MSKHYLIKFHDSALSCCSKVSMVMPLLSSKLSDSDISLDFLLWINELLLSTGKNLFPVVDVGEHDPILDLWDLLKSEVLLIKPFKQLVGFVELVIEQLRVFFADV